MSQLPGENYIGRPGGQAWFGRTYSLKFYDKNGQFVHEIYSDQRNSWAGLRIKFNIEQEAYYINQMAQISIYNVNGKTKRLLESSSIVVLSAGYQLNSGIVYQGNIVNAYDNRVQPDYVFLLVCLDYQRQYLPISLTIKKGSTPQEAIEQFASVVNDVKFNAVNMRNLPTKPIEEDIHIPQMEYTMAMNKLGDILGVRIWITNTNIYAIPRNMTSAPTNAPVIEIDYKNGMVGSPSFNVANTGVNITSLLNHKLAPASLVKVKTLNPQVQAGQAKFINFTQQDIAKGEWLIQSVTHQGDSWDGEWTTFIQGYSYKPLGRNVL